MKSKIVFFLLCATSFSGIIGCGDKLAENLRDKHIIPYVQVETEIDLNIGGEGNLNFSGQPQYISLSRPLGKPLGYNGNGLVIIKISDEYKCWDATCTNCPDLTSHFEQTDLDGELAVCPKCSMQFSLRLGSPFNSPKRIYALKEYPISLYHSKLIVRY